MKTGVFVCAFSASYWLFYRIEAWYHRRKLLQKSRQTRSSQRRPSQIRNTPRPSQLPAHGFVDAARKMGKMAVPKKQKELDRIRQQLVHAGFPQTDALIVYYGLRVIAGLGLALIQATFMLVADVFFSRLFITLFIPFGVGYYLPVFLLKRKILYRRTRIFMELPDALDLLNICLRAGLGFDASLYRVCRELEAIAPVLSREFGLYFLEIRGGLDRETALAHLEQRNPSRALKSVTGVLLQSAKSGTDMADALSVYMTNMRTERRQKAEEQAGKLSTKLTLPLVVFILPAMMLIILGPTIINFVILVKEGF